MEVASDELTTVLSLCPCFITSAAAWSADYWGCAVVAQRCEQPSPKLRLPVLHCFWLSTASLQRDKVWHPPPKPWHLTGLPLEMGLGQGSFQALSRSGRKRMQLYHRNVFLSLEPSLLPTMTCSTQRQSISCCFLILPTLSKELLLHLELITTPLADTLWKPGTHL